jgi:hypothetical protein
MPPDVVVHLEERYQRQQNDHQDQASRNPEEPHLFAKPP